MGKLRNLKPTLSSLSPRIARQTDTHGHSKSEPLRRLYSTARWKALRWFVLVRDLFTCQMCGLLEGDTSNLVADHKRPHRGDPALFWDPQNLWCLCSPCHNSAKQAEERRPEG